MTNSRLQVDTNVSATYLASDFSATTLQAAFGKAVPIFFAFG